jgi:hypothetical protein
LLLFEWLPPNEAKTEDKLNQLFSMSMHAEIAAADSPESAKLKEIFGASQLKKKISIEIKVGSFPDCSVWYDYLRTGNS